MPATSRSRTHHPPGVYLDHATPWSTAAVTALVDDANPALTPRVTHDDTVLQYLDTFDGHLRRADRVLERRGRGRDAVLQLRPYLAACRHAPQPSPPVPFLAGPVSGSFLRHRLAALCGGRALLSMARTRVAETVVALVDSEDKTRVRVRLCEQYLTGGRRKPSRWLLVEPLTGYRTDCRRTLAALRRAGFEESGDPADRALRANGAGAGDHVPGTTNDMRPDTPTRAVFSLIGRGLLDVMGANLPGLRGDWDNEFLHDYRVALRRTRSLLAQVPGVLPEPRQRHFAGEFRWIGNLSGAARDGDVQRAEMRDLVASVAASERRHLDPLLEWIGARRAESRRQLLAALEGRRYQRLVADWRRLLAAPMPRRSVLANATRPVGVVAAERIAALYEKVVRKGSRIDDASPPTALHELRKDAKKLRYLVEFFRPLYVRERVALLVADLKQLQDNLGEYQDLDVQRALLDEFVRQAPAATVALLESLAASMRQREARVREDFASRFQAFSSPPVRAHLDAMLAGREPS